MTVLLMLCGLVFGFQSCNEKPKEKEQTVPVFNLIMDKAEIKAANKNFMELVSVGNSIGLANAYTIDAKFMSPGKPSVVGRANIQTAMSNMILSGITGVDLKLENIYITENLIAEEGELILFAGDNAVAVEKYMVLWKKEDGKRKLFRDIFNSNLPIE